MRGTIGNPYTLSEALSSQRIFPGHTLYLRGGVYNGAFTASLIGTSDERITIRPYPGERAIVTNMTVNGSYVDFIGIEFAYDGWTTRESVDGSDLPEKSLDIRAPGCRFINCVIHDLRGVGFWALAENAEFYGCVVYYIGWMGKRGFNHALYTQNQTGAKVIKHNIFHSAFGWGIHAYSSSGDNLQGFDIIENVSFDAGVLSGTLRRNILLGGDSDPALNNTLRGNLTYGGGSGLQFYGAGAEGVTLTDNYLPDGVIGTYTAAEESGNYYGGSGIGNQTFLHANEYDNDRAHLTIYNEAETDSVQVDVSAVFDAGDTILARNVQDLWVDTQTLTVAGDGTITVDMQAANRSVATPVGWTAPSTTFPAFGCYVLERTS